MAAIFNLCFWLHFGPFPMGIRHGLNFSDGGRNLFSELLQKLTLGLIADLDRWLIVMNSTCGLHTAYR